MYKQKQKKDYNKWSNLDDGWGRDEGRLVIINETSANEGQYETYIDGHVCQTVLIQ